MKQWIEQMLWGPGGWMDFHQRECFGVARIGKAERQRIQDAAEFLVRCLGNNRNADTQAAVDSIVSRRVEVLSKDS